MTFTHDDYHFSVTIYSDYLEVVGCLRVLSQFSQQEGNNRIPWGGTKDVDWKRDEKKVTFRFTSAAYRQLFLDVAGRVLKPNLWREVPGSRNDSDPATPQSE
jgi:hypothetical protein